MQFSRDRLLDRYGDHNRVGQIYFLPEHSTMYVANPKAACSSVKLLFERIAANDPELVIQNVHKNRTIPRLGQIGWGKVNAALARGVYGFTIVRDPVARAVSAYADKLVQPNYRAMFNEALGRPRPRASVSFNTFLSGLEAMDPAAMDPHWRPQSQVLMVDEIDYDFIGRLENLSADMAQVFDASDLPLTPLPHRNSTATKPKLEVNRRQRARLEQIYAADFEAFGY